MVNCVEHLKLLQNLKRQLSLVSYHLERNIREVISAEMRDVR